MVISELDMLSRLGTAAALGAAVGWERQRRGHAAGLRDHLLVALASATFMLVSAQFVYFQSYAPGEPVAVDPSRIAASVVSGVGFLGAGAILRTGVGVQGLTTAASLWLTSSVGLAAGGGMFGVAGVAAAVALLSLVLLRRMERGPGRPATRRVTVLLKGSGGARRAAVGAVRAAGLEASEAGYELHVRRGRSRLVLDVVGADDAALDRLTATLAGVPEFTRVKVRVQPVKVLARL